MCISINWEIGYISWEILDCEICIYDQIIATRMIFCILILL